MNVVALDSHRPVLGGSTIAAAAGIDPWVSPVELFYRLRGELPPPDGEPLGWGRAVQPLIFDALRERGHDVTETPEVELHDAARPWLAGHPDGVDAYGSVVEAKLTGGYGYRKGGALPLNWQAQAQTYMHLSAAESTVVAVLVSGIRLDVHEVVYDERAANLLLDLAAGFVDLLRSGTPPPPDGSESAKKALALRFPAQAPGRVYRLTGFEWETAKNLLLLREQKAEVERQITELENRVKACDPEAETFIDPFDNTFATWKENATRRVDVTLLKTERPELADLFTRETTQRRFVIHV